MKIKETAMVIGRILGIAISITLISYTIFAWTGPTGEPPNENLPGPLNSLAETQYKTGALGIGGLFQTNTETHLAISGGNVGIGTTNPSRSLTIESTAEHLQLNNPNAGSNITRIFMNGNGDLEFLTGTTPTNRMLIGQNGNIGIGTTSPGAKLHIGGVAGTDGIKFPDGSLQTRAVRIHRSQVSTGSITNGTWLPGSITFYAEAGEKVTLSLSYTGRPNAWGHTYVKLYLNEIHVHSIGEEQNSTWRRTIDGTVHLTIGTTGNHTFTAQFECGSGTTSMTDGVAGEWPYGGLAWTVIVGG